MITNAGLKEINARYTGKTGVTFKMAGAEITKLADAIKTTNPPPDIIFMPTDMMTKLEASGGVRPGERVHLGRMQIGLAVAKGAPHPDISTVAKLAAVLKAARLVVYTDPSNGSLAGADDRRAAESARIRRGAQAGQQQGQRHRRPGAG